MRTHTVLRVGGVLTAAGLLLSPTAAWADNQDGWSEQPQDYSQQWEPGTSSEPTRSAQDTEAAVSGSGTSKEMAPSGSTSAAQIAATTCSIDASLPFPVVATVVDTVGTVQDTLEGVTGPLPVDLAGSLGGALGCTPEPSATPEPVPSDEPSSPPVEDPQAEDSADLAAISTGLPEAASAEAVDAQVAFAG